MYWHNLSYANTQFFAMLLMIRAFSTRHPAMAFIPDVRLICHWLLPAFVPTMFRPLSCSSEATLKTTKESSQGSQQQMMHRLMIAPTFPPVSRARGRFSVSSKSCYAIITPSGKNRNGLISIALERGTTALIALRSRNSQRDILHGSPSTRREMSGEMGKHSKPPPDIRRRPMHSKGGAFV